MRIAASAGRRGLPCRQPEPEDRDVLVGDDPAVSVSMSTTSLSVRIDLAGQLHPEPQEIEAARDLVDRLLASEPAPTISLAQVDAPKEGQEEATDSPEGASADAGRLYVRIEAVTPLEQGMTDTQLDGYLAWATFLVDRCAVAFENILPLTRVRKED